MIWTQVIDNVTSSDLFVKIFGYYSINIYIYIYFLTYTASPEEVPSVLQHSIDIDELPLSDGDEPAVSRVVVLQCTSYQDGVCAGM